jgi:hypothetical protein
MVLSVTGYGRVEDFFEQGKEFKIPSGAGNLLTSSTTISFLRRTVIWKVN